MKTNTSNSAKDSSRCQHHFTNSSRCRLLVSGRDSQFCVRHSKLPENQPELCDLSADLAAGITEFKSATPLNDFLSRLLLLLAQDRIAPRRAAVMAYITNQLLRTLREIDRENNPEDEIPQIIVNIPRPNRDADWSSAQPQYNSASQYPTHRTAYNPGAPDAPTAT